MDIEQIRKFCLSLPNATERVQWGDDLLFCIGNKMFAVAGLGPMEPSYRSSVRLKNLLNWLSLKE